MKLFIKTPSEKKFWHHLQKSKKVSQDTFLTTMIPANFSRTLHKVLNQQNKLKKKIINYQNNQVTLNHKINLTPIDKKTTILEIK